MLAGFAGFGAGTDVKESAGWTKCKRNRRSGFVFFGSARALHDLEFFL